MLRFALFATPDGLDMEHDAVFRVLTRMSETARRQTKAEDHVCDLVEDIARRIWIKEAAVRAFLYLSDNDLDALQAAGSDFPLLMLLETSQSFLDDIYAYWHVGLRNHHDVQQIPFWLQSFTERWNARHEGTEVIPDKYLNHLVRTLKRRELMALAKTFDARGRRLVLKGIRIIADYRDEARASRDSRPVARRVDMGAQSSQLMPLPLE